MKNMSPKKQIKLLILYLLKSASFPLNHENLSNFFLDKYTSYIQFQQILAELVDNKLVEEYKTKTSILYSATEDGLATIEAINSTEDGISEENKIEIEKYIKDNKIKMRENSQVRATYTDNINGGYKIILEIKENNNENFKIEIDVPDIDTAETMCEKFKQKSKNIYTYVMKQIL